MTLQVWDHVRFTDLLKVDPTLAWEYRRDCGLGEVPEEFRREEPSIDPTVEQMKELLTSNDIKFSHLAGEKKLKELCVANNLL